jgi:hypothetical protein
MASCTTHSPRFSAIGQAAALALGLLSLAGAAVAQDAITEIIKSTTGGAIPVAVTPYNGVFQYFITKGLSGDCGRLYQSVETAPGVFEAVLRYTFKSDDKAGCNPVSIEFSTDRNEIFVEVTTSQGGTYGTGGTLTFNVSSNRVESVQPNAPGATPVGSTVAPPPLQASGDRAAQDAMLYVTTSNGGASNNGAIFASAISGTGKLSAPTLVFSFPGGAGGAQPMAPAVAGADGNLYGTTFAGGSTNAACTQFSNGCGIVYQLTPPAGPASQWNENMLHTFTLGGDFAFPLGRLTFDANGNVYGSASSGGSKRTIPSGGVYMLTPGATLPWTMTQLYTFSSGNDGSDPQIGVTLDADGNVFGTTLIGGRHYLGVVFELLKPATLTKAFWKEVVLHAFVGAPTDGAGPSGEVTLNGEDVYGTTFAGGRMGMPPCEAGDLYFSEPGCGTVFELTPK